MKQDSLGINREQDADTFVQNLVVGVQPVDFTKDLKDRAPRFHALRRVAEILQHFRLDIVTRQPVWPAEHLDYDRARLPQIIVEPSLGCGEAHLAELPRP